MSIHKKITADQLKTSVKTTIKIKANYLNINPRNQIPKQYPK